MYQKYYRRHMIKSGIIIACILLFSVISTYFIYQKFSNARNQGYDSGEMEVVFHEKQGNEISLTQFVPVTDAVGLTSNAYTFTVYNNTLNSVSYKVILAKDQETMLEDGCIERQIPDELLKLSFREDHQAPTAMVLSEYQDGVLHTGTLAPGESEDYSIRLWAMNSNFIVDRTSHFHAIIEVIEEEV